MYQICFVCILDSFYLVGTGGALMGTDNLAMGTERAFFGHRKARNGHGWAQHNGVAFPKLAYVLRVAKERKVTVKRL